MTPQPPSTESLHPFLQRLTEATSRVVVGHHELLERLCLGLLCRGHVLLEGVPGVAKTLTVSALASSLNLTFRRVPFTPDLLPADLKGTPIFDPSSGTFRTHRGPIFTNILLADEINRAPAKVQSALLEAMQERLVTLGDETFELDEPFLVLATQNPIEHEGTYPLPEAQLDRFFMKVRVGYPTREDEKRILERMGKTHPKLTLTPVIDKDELRELQAVVDEVYVDERVCDYILDLIEATRHPSAHGLRGLDAMIDFGASPRASVALVLASKGLAMLRGRDHVLPQDIKEIGFDVLRHRIMMSFEAQAAGMDAETFLDQVFASVAVP